MICKGTICCCCCCFATPWNVAHQAPLFMGFPRQEYWSGLPSPSPADLCDPVIKPSSPALAESSLTTSSVQSLSRVLLLATPWIAALQASLSITNSQSSLRLMSIESVMPSSHLILFRPLLLLPPILPSIRVFSNESTLRMRRPKYWSFSFSIIPSKEIPGLISCRMHWLDLLAVQGTPTDHQGSPKRKIREIQRMGCNYVSHKFSVWEYHIINCKAAHVKYVLTEASGSRLPSGFPTATCRFSYGKR